MSESKVTVYPVILSGGSGTRLWPKSRSLYPKQFHRLTSEETLLQEALSRVKDKSIYGNPIVVCNEDHRFMVSEQAKEMGVNLQDIILEPEARNSAPAVGAATARIQSIDPNGLVLILASDHHIADPEAFNRAVLTGIPAAVAGQICTFGVTPGYPETGYGYIKRTDKQVKPGVYKIDQFKEKPDLETAKKYLADGNYAWNAGLFLFSAKCMMDELAIHEPSIPEACRDALAHGSRDGGVFRLSQPHFHKAKATSVDYAVMERTQLSCVIPLDAQWTDVGSWPSLYSTVLGKNPDPDGNVLRGDCSTMDVKNCYLSSDGPLLTAIGLEDICVIATEDATLVVPMNRAQDVGAMAKSLARKPAKAHFAKQHVSEYEPWGSMKKMTSGPNFQVNQLTINPGGAKSSQCHFHRSEHWVVVSGTALVSHNGTEILLNENQSTFIPVGTKHRLENPGKIPLVVIEVQSGSYLGKDDIMRFEDNYGRSTVSEAASKIPALSTSTPASTNTAATAVSSAPAASSNNSSFLQTLGSVAVGVAIAMVCLKK